MSTKNHPKNVPSNTNGGALGVLGTANMKTQKWEFGHIFFYVCFPVRKT